MKNKIALFIVAAMIAPSAFAAEISPYVGLGLVIDKAGTSAKRVGYDETTRNVLPNGGGDMKFDMAYAGEITAGVKWGSVRGEIEVALRSASEDGYNIYSIAQPEFGSLSMDASTSVRHNSYLFNMYYDFEFQGSSWAPYIGAGIGVGSYRQLATLNLQAEGQMAMGVGAMGLKLGDNTVADNDLYRFEWQVGLGAAYNFNEDWAFDIGYRFNSSNVGGEFVYAHEVKMGIRYLF